MRSMTKAPRARYPESSSTAMKAKSRKMWGKKTTTDPTPPTTPSVTKDTAREGSPRKVMAAAAHSPARAMTSSRKEAAGSPRK